MDLYVRIENWHTLTKKKKAEPIAGKRRGHGRRHYCRVGRGEQGEARPAKSLSRGGPHLEQGEARPAKAYREVDLISI